MLLLSANMMRRNYKRVRRRLVFMHQAKKAIVVLLVFILMYNFEDLRYLFSYRIWHVLTYSTRPLWDTAPDLNFTVLPYFGSRLRLTDQKICEMHGWKVREKPVKVYDAFLFSNELDILEIRLQELKDVVDKFVIIESNTTFTGVEKPFMLSDHIKNNPGTSDTFTQVKSKLVLHKVGGRKLDPGEDAFKQEAATRKKMKQFLKEAGLAKGDILIVSDVDEIPRAEVVTLFKKCTGMPPVVHLDMISFQYSFGFKRLDNSWKAALHIYNGNKTRYNHKLKSNFKLPDAGWHCSFCFHKISDFQFKMLAYSHSERALRHSKLLSADHIQKQICDGQDLYDMWPEAYTFGDLLKMLNGYERIHSGRDVPRWVLENKDRFNWLLPGGNCSRPLD